MRILRFADLSGIDALHPVFEGLVCQLLDGKLGLRRGRWLVPGVQNLCDASIIPVGDVRIGPGAREVQRTEDLAALLAVRVSGLRKRGIRLVRHATRTLGHLDSFWSGTLVRAWKRERRRPSGCCRVVVDLRAALGLYRKPFVYI